MTQYDAKFIIECLRAGIASNAVSEIFSHGQTRVINAFQEHLGGSGGAMAIEAGYGQGKTHLLKHLGQLARRRGYVVSLVSLSKETPFHHWWHLYGQAITQAERPDAPNQLGLRGLLARQKWNDVVTQGLQDFGEQVHPRLSVALRCYYQARDGEQQYRALGDLMGHALSNSELSRMYREATNTRVKLPAARLAQTGRDYFQFAGKLFQLAGYAGWVILFDEFELVCKLSALQRAKAYANLGRFVQRDLPGFERTVGVVAFIPGMVTDYLAGGTQDLQNLPNSLRVRGLEADAEAAESTIRWLVERKNPLAGLSESDTHGVLDQIAAIHERAYDWCRPPGRFYVPAMSAAERMRTKVRFCVEALDLARYYGEAPVVETHEVPQPGLAEDPELFAGSAGEIVVEEVDR